jgi:hypothetical protein
VSIGQCPSVVPPMAGRDKLDQASLLRVVRPSVFKTSTHVRSVAANFPSKVALSVGLIWFPRLPIKLATHKGSTVAKI